MSSKNRTNEDHRRLFFDIETSPNIGFFGSSGWKVNLPAENIIHERAIICIGYKWEHEKIVHFLKWDKNQNDKAMLLKFIKVMNQADEVVTHNGDRFDITWLRTRCLFHGIPMVPDYVSIDTLKIARGKFKFNSNRLQYIAQFLGLGGKHHTGFDLWVKIVLGKDPVAMKKMVEYCKNDVVLLEKIWERLNSYVKSKSSIAEYPSQCPECGSENTVVNQRRVTASGHKKISFRCTDCGKYNTIAASRFDKDKAMSMRE